MPYTLTAQHGETGDLNGDGTSANDPIYIPRDVRDASEIRFNGAPDAVAGQEAALESLIARTPCLDRQRGRIMARNSCRAPWVHDLDLSLRQTLPRVGPGPLSLELQVFNFLNLLNSRWGLSRQPNNSPLIQVGQSTGTDSAPIFEFDTTFDAYSGDDPASYYQLQLGARYSF